MSIKINVNPVLYHYTNNQSVVEVSGDTVGQCLDHLVKQFPGTKKVLFDKKGNLLDYVELYVNRESIYPEELTKSVKGGDELHILFRISPGG